ncbi:hypothetical protein P3T76_008500 [Phytophthora citrophthora]|uniref:Uncharacterized protein n=1 Tax=Phytophthora citrophthora TaxID=4793 RepID=A0AAD9LLM7_9STRA|nr:hypothetical protein P3T76_008500 [Phytophthora citrophthora]
MSFEPREDKDVAELVGIIVIRLGAFKDSLTQVGRLYEAHGWLYEMSGRSFSPTIDLTSLPPPPMTGVYLTANSGFRSKGDVEDGFTRIANAKSTKSFSFLTMTLYVFLAATAILTANRQLLSLNELIRFNKNYQGLKELNIKGEGWGFFNHAKNSKRCCTSCGCSCTGTIDVLLALFPSSVRPPFVYPSRAARASE